MGQFEVLGLNRDRQLIRVLAKQLAADSPDLRRLREPPSSWLAMGYRPTVASSLHYAVRLWLEPA